MQIGDHVAQFLEVVALEQRLAFDHDQHIELGRREPLRHLLVLMIFLGVGAKELAEGIIDLDAVDAKYRTDHHGEQDDAGQDRCADRDQADPLESEGDAGRPFDRAGQIGSVRVSLKHALSILS